ncbi:hypothetical protein [Coraliomargarita parva]|uniref:hypothetical protein n=1 Tax=Coraliomargarita parva TaxID=3014050 RepID=UPI0022B49B62|nr:hypothetical protein [Coraliomargarita parva]
MNPISTDNLDRLDPTKQEEKISAFPLIGNVLGYAMERMRFEPVEKEINRTLKERDESEIRSAWSGFNRDVVDTLLEILKKEMGWKKPHFIPDDPTRVALWAHVDGMDTVEALMQLEERFKIEFEEEELTDESTRTLRGLVRLIESKRANQARVATA